MQSSSTSIFDHSARSDWVRVRTLIVLRWLAISGQSLAVYVCIIFLELDIPIGLCSVVIGASVIFNLVSTFVLPENKRLSERQTVLTLLFDLGQLGLLLFINGGLSNPFALLILAPVTISATTLRRDATLLVGGVALIMITALTQFYIPLHLRSGSILELPAIFLLGTWAALVIGILFLSAYARRVTVETFTMSQALTATQMAMAREHELTMLGGVVAAAAHEMGTPLATIKLVSAELAEDLAKLPELQEDALLIHSQTERLRQILQDMGRSGKDDMLIKTVPLTLIVQSAAEPHLGRGKEIRFLANGSEDFFGVPDIPFISSKPEIIHGIRNLVQNAVDYAESTVWVQSIWTDDSISILVGDDGSGFPAELIGRIGDPFLSSRRRHQSKGTPRSTYQSMGLGLFIAKTMLERTGARLTFANAAVDGYAKSVAGSHLKNMRGATGAFITVRWNRRDIEQEKNAVAGPNPPIENI